MTDERSDTISDGGGLAPRVVVKTHRDGDPKPRPEEIAEWDAVRREHALKTMVAVILLPKGTVPTQPAQRSASSWPEHDMYGWVIEERDGEVVCESEEIRIEVTSGE